MEQKTEPGNIAAIRQIFPDTTMQELKQLSSADRQELGDLCRAELAKGCK